MPNRGSKQKYTNVVCWLLGHDVDGKTIANSRRTSSGEMGPGWQYYCKRCQNPDNFPIGQYTDRRNLYQRTIRVWVVKLRNRWRFRHFERDARRSMRDPQYLRHLDEQLKRYSPKEPET